MYAPEICLDCLEVNHEECPSTGSNRASFGEECRVSVSQRSAIPLLPSRPSHPAICYPITCFTLCINMATASEHSLFPFYFDSSFSSLLCSSLFIPPLHSHRQMSQVHITECVVAPLRVSGGTDEAATAIRHVSGAARASLSRTQRDWAFGHIWQTVSNQDENIWVTDWFHGAYSLMRSRQLLSYSGIFQ
jgi:hypothetical protein